MNISIYKKTLRTLFVVWVILEGFLWSQHLSGEVDQNLTNALSAMFILVYLTGAIISFHGCKLAGVRSSVGSALLFFGLALSSYVLALLTWVYYTNILNVETPYPSVADFFFILYIPLIIIAGLRLARIYQFSITKRIIVESVAFLIPASALILYYFGLPDFADTESNWQTNFFDLAYTIGGILIATTVFTVVRVSGGKLYKGLIYIILGALFQLIGDFIFAYETEQEIFWEGGLSDISFILSGFFWALAVLSTAVIVAGSKKA